jgi:hypothetical protein
MSTEVKMLPAFMENESLLPCPQKKLLNYHSNQFSAVENQALISVRLILIFLL